MKNTQSGIAGILVLLIMTVGSALGTGFVTIKKPAQINFHPEVFQHGKAEYNVNK